MVVSLFSEYKDDFGPNILSAKYHLKLEAMTCIPLKKLLNSLTKNYFNLGSLFTALV